jgi:hypothetical protein
MLFFIGVTVYYSACVRVGGVGSGDRQLAGFDTEENVKVEWAVSEWRPENRFSLFCVDCSVFAAEEIWWSPLPLMYCRGVWVSLQTVVCEGS